MIEKGDRLVGTTTVVQRDKGGRSATSLMNRGALPAIASAQAVPPTPLRANESG